jgi:hypothetical protein
VPEYPYIPLDNKGWRLAMGLRPLEESRWFEVDEHREEELALKNSLLTERRTTVVATRARANEASDELLEAIVMNLTKYHPSLSLEVNYEEHPIVAASRLVQEDLCILVRDNAWRLEAACVCFPSRWSLVNKIGASLDDIHEPVPGYDMELASPTNAVFNRMTPQRSFWRLNWTLLDDEALHQPSNTSSLHIESRDEWFFRVERQTLRQLEKTKAIVFTIRTYVSPLSELRETSGEFYANLVHAIEAAPTSMKEYKGWIGVAEKLRSAL